MTDGGMNPKSVKCQRCQRTFRADTPAALTCQQCQRMPTNQASRPTSSPRETTQSGNNNAIPSAYLQLLDSRIADLESAAEASRSSDQSATNATGTDRPARPGSTKSVTVTPYMTDATRWRTSRTSSRQSQASSVVMERFLNDPSEPDAV